MLIYVAFVFAIVVIAFLAYRGGYNRGARTAYDTGFAAGADSATQAIQQATTPVGTCADATGTVMAGGITQAGCTTLCPTCTWAQLP
jgi:uncharacterized protein YdeI (BOF family)